ncbi:hypothetical protein Ddye_013635 [Dipteronia dyeriana]|uniref:Uncharacterized protein n=1 Tax=Dipteronia dyeriana TaxID=168575 RepID=A0AAD9X6M5_9ROSI|nr:hypothetical protein Ddye_013635 [Dipteronia dyeriana]
MWFSRPMRRSRCQALMVMTKKPKGAREADISGGGRLANAFLSEGDDDHSSASWGFRFHWRTDWTGVFENWGFGDFSDLGEKEKRFNGVDGVVGVLRRENITRKIAKMEN